jgi:WS/DGAT/MGAT family acyltransferase
LATTPLNPERPLWQFHLIECYEGGSALILRIHHCIADGIALISVMNSITDNGNEPPQRSPHAHGDEPERHDWLSDAVLKPLTGAAVHAIDLYGDGVARSMDMLAHPSEPLADTLSLARHGKQLAGDLAALALMADDTHTRLKRKLAGRKRVCWSEPMPLDVVKVVGKALNCSINDVLLSCASGAIGKWLREQGDDTSGAEIRAMVPVNLRPLEKAWQLGNRFGLAPLVLPIGITNPVERVYAVNQRMGQLKGSYQPMLTFGVLAIAGLLNKPLQEALLGLFAKKATAVMTNVPGPREPLKFCGSTLRQSLFWVPASGDVGVGVSILSYGGGVQFGLITDEALCPDPQAIIDHFEPEFQQLLLLAMMLPWGHDT